jgi:hypothetical protein
MFIVLEGEQIDPMLSNTAEVRKRALKSPRSQPWYDSGVQF